MAALAGVTAAAAQAVIDLYAGFRAADKPEMKEIFAQVRTCPGVMPAVSPSGRSSSTWG